MPWYRVWTDILDSEKFAELDDATIGGWTLILSAVKRFDQGGLLPPDKKLCHWTRRPKARVTAWIESLLDAGLLEGTAEGVRVHDWDHWQEPKDRTNAQRQAKFKAAKKALSALSKETEETDNRERAEETVTAAPLPAGGNESVTALPPALPPSIRSASGEADKRAIEIAAKRWGASNGDAVVADLLQTFEPELVIAAMDSHYDTNGKKLKPALLRGKCRGMFDDGWTPTTNKNGKHNPEPEPNFVKATPGWNQPPRKATT